MKIDLGEDFGPNGPRVVKDEHGNEVKLTWTTNPGNGHWIAEIPEPPDEVVAGSFDPEEEFGFATRTAYTRRGRVFMWSAAAGWEECQSIPLDS